ncbi:MAG: methylmalonyl Co-A mutase-associated GTPase MeaB [Chloroflexi bacterium]|nr:methylmalonyl Co-A mutase-associated GTPase MeaB [Chloroflexota bacterium]
MLVAQVLAGDRRALARFLTAVETDRESVAAELAQLFLHADGAIIGVTGAPGVGKSVLVGALAKVFRQRGQSVAIIAVDPSSPFSGGAILGDRIRMKSLSGDPGVFIRSMASRGRLGGLAWTTQDVARVLCAAGFDVVIIETVGAGQSDVEIARLAHTTAVVLAPGAGDSVQALKAGILEIGDVLAVNKCDLPGARETARTLQSMLELNHPSKPLPLHAPPWQPPVVLTSALKEQGIDELADSIAEHQRYLDENGLLALHRENQARSELEARLKASIAQHIFDSITPAELAGIIKRIAERETHPQAAADALLAKYIFSRAK